MDDFAPHTDIKWNGTVGTVQYGGGDRNMVAMFYTKAAHNPAKSADSGRPVYEDKVFVRIHPPGERLNIVDRPATANDQRRFPAQWAQFKENREQIPEGTPVDLLYPDQPSIAAMLRANNVHTVEQLAELSATAIESIGMGTQTYVNNAQKYLQMSNKGMAAAQVRRELEDRDRQIKTMAGTIESLKQQVDKLMEERGQNSGIDLATLQQFIAGQQGRPQYPANAPKQMPQAFDAATAQINATSPTADIVRQKATKRSRARIQG
jgi:hypothetical protein